LWSCPRQARRRYWSVLEEDCGERLVLLRPRLGGTGTMVPKRGDVERLVGAGEEALQGEALARVRAWIAPEAARGAGFP
ncbi:MAG TPA: hypothetical protein VFT43_10430, partial [Candidatus Polarisedimenticolia bacterium]|nr:hypothetical protein [Candidatus Polarisedimenticolia bacterium]